MKGKAAEVSECPYSLLVGPMGQYLLDCHIRSTYVERYLRSGIVRKRQRGCVSSLAFLLSQKALGGMLSQGLFVLCTLKGSRGRYP